MEFAAAVAAVRYDVPQARIGIHLDSRIDTGSTLTALAAGVPQAFVPLFVDGPANAARVAELGAGVGLLQRSAAGHAIR